MPMPDQLRQTPLLVVADVAKRFGPHQVLGGVRFTLDAGEIAVLAGGNGAGKSTLLRCLVGLAGHDGDATLMGMSMAARETRAHVGYLPQRVALPDTATGRECLALFSRLRGVDTDSHGLPDGFLPPLDSPVGTLSGGQRQRIALAVALLGQPCLLLLDEPGANLDDTGRRMLWAHLRERTREGASVLVSSPSPDDLAAIATRRILLRDGVVAEDSELVPDDEPLAEVRRCAR